MEQRIRKAGATQDICGKCGQTGSIVPGVPHSGITGYSCGACGAQWQVATPTTAGELPGGRDCPRCGRTGAFPEPVAPKSACPGCGVWAEDTLPSLRPVAPPGRMDRPAIVAAPVSPSAATSKMKTSTKWWIAVGALLAVGAIGNALHPTTEVASPPSAPAAADCGVHFLHCIRPVGSVGLAFAHCFDSMCADSGNDMVLATLTIKNDGSQSESVSAFDFTLHTSDGVGEPHDYRTYSMAKPMPSVTLAPDGQVGGQVLFQAATGTTVTDLCIREGTGAPDFCTTDFA